MARKKTKPASEDVRIIALGASAGGLEPFEQFFDNMQGHTGLAFVIIQHLSPDFESMMDELLARHSSMKIERVKNRMKLKPNTIYLNPPRTEMTVRNGLFSLKKQPRDVQLNMPIDSFFSSLADEAGDDAVAIVLSGTGTDGTLGARNIKEAGGTVLAQEPTSAKFDSMPGSIIRSGLATAVGDPSELASYVDQIAAGETITVSAGAEGSIETIVSILRNRFGTDFNYYKKPTIERRIGRRAFMRGLTTEQYAEALASDPNEVELLYGDMLIEVTEFFRDQKAFQELENKVIPNVMNTMTETRPIRVWVPGCASGEEAYSLAILFAEQARKKRIPLNLKILATDIHHRSLAAATKGIFTRDSLVKLSDENVERYFERIGNDYQINQSLRRMVMFSAHNILRDPPFTKIDLISCRNVLIYLNDVAQKKTLALFHFALSAKGYLFLGPSETSGQLSHEYETVSARWRLYQKKRNVRLIDSTTLLPAKTPTSTHGSLASPIQRNADVFDVDFKHAQREALQSMLDEHAPPGFLIQEDGKILHVFGTAGSLLDVRAGEFSDKIVDYLDGELKLVFSTGMQRLRNSTAQDTFERRFVTTDGESERKTVIVKMRAVRPKNAVRNLYLVVLAEENEIRPKLDYRNIPAIDKVEAKEMLLEQVQDLEAELSATEENLQNTIEELETSNEELQATNEELMASNEELQSTNEELHSVNEELHTVSSEHEKRIHELMETTEDLNQLLQSTNFGIVFLGKRLCVRRFTKAASSVFNILPSDVGRPFAHLTYRFKFPELDKVIEKVEETGENFETEIQVEKRSFVLRIIRYTSKIQDVSGVLVVTVDVTDLKQSEVERERANAQFAAVVHDLTDFVVRWSSKNNQIEFCNDVFARIFAEEPENLIGKSIRNLGAEGRKLSVFSKLARSKEEVDFENAEIISPQGLQNVFVSGTVRPVYNDGVIEAFQSTGRNVSQTYYYRRALEDLIKALESKTGDEREVIERILKVGCDYFHVDRGVAVRVDGPEATVIAKSGTNFGDIDDTNTIKADSLLWPSMNKHDGVASCDNVGKSEYARLKPYRAYKNTIYSRETYIASKFETLDGTVGIVAFASRIPRGTEYTRTDEIFAKTIAQYIGQLMDRNAYLSEIDSQRQELIAANDQLSTFAYVASHDLQEPVRKILHFSDMLRDEHGLELDKEANYYVDTISGSAKRMAALVRDILAYTTASNTEMKIQKLDLAAILVEIKDDLSEQLSEKKAKLRINKMPNIEGDPAAVRLLFQNLISNAIKYSHPDRPPSISVRAKTDKTGQRFEVVDNGLGISGKNAGKIFAPFVRLHAKNKYSGSGIGLAVCKSICDRLGWEIGYSDNPKGGTIFTIYLPS